MARCSTIPDLIACCVIGDGEAETGALAASWHSNKFLNPARDGAVLPILHLNGYKIAGPTVLARMPRRGTGGAVARLRLRAVFRGRPRSGADAPDHGGDARYRWWQRSAAIQKDAREQGFSERPFWPMIVLRSPKGWTGPENGGWRPDRRHFPRPPGAARRSGHQAGAHEACSKNG